MPIVKEIGKHNVFFSMVSAKEKHRTPCVSKFSAKGSAKPQPAERGGGRIRAWDPRFSRPAPRRLRLVERHQIAARYAGEGGGGGVATEKPCVFDVSRGGTKGGGYPLSSLRCPIVLS